MGQVAHLATRFIEQVIVFWPSFDGPGLGPAGTPRDLIGSQSFQERLIKTAIRLGGICDAGEMGGKLAEGVTSAFETDPIDGKGSASRSLNDEPPDEIIGDQVEMKFAADHLGGAAA